MGALVAVLVSFPLWRAPVREVLDRFLPDPEYRAAEDRTSAPAPTGEALPLPAPQAHPAGAGTDPAIRVRDLAPLAGPSAVVDVPGPGPLLVTTLEGRLHALDRATGAVEVVLDLADQVASGGERGLLGAAVDPLAERLYLDYTNLDGDTEVRSWPLDGDGLPAGGPGDGVLHLAIGQPFANHNGGNLVFGPDGALWIGTGDGGSSGDPGEVAQDPDSLLGKMLRVVPLPDGGVEAPASNPAWDGRPEVWGIGLRNPWRYSFDRATHELWIADVGQDSFEEVSVVAATEERPDFGWDEVEGLAPYEGEREAGQVPPVVTYPRADGCSVTGGYVYRGAAIPGLYGWYLFSDYCAGWIRAVQADSPEQPPVELLPSAGSVVGFAELEDGELLVLTTGSVLAVEPG